MTIPAPAANAIHIDTYFPAGNLSAEGPKAAIPVVPPEFAGDQIAFLPQSGGAAARPGFTT